MNFPLVHFEPLFNGREKKERLGGGEVSMDFSSVMLKGDLIDFGADAGRGRKIIIKTGRVQ